MSSDWTVISVDEPTQRILVEAMLESVPELNVREVQERLLLEIYDDAGTVVAAVELPGLIHNPSEVDRLLTGASVSAPNGSCGVPALFQPDTGLTNATVRERAQPLWWQGLHVPRGSHDGSRRADLLCHAIARRCRGVVIEPLQEES